MKRTKFNLTVLLIAVVYFIILVIGNVTVSSVGVAAVEGSYAYKFAKSKNLPLIELADSEKGYLDQRYELFEYNEVDGGLCIESYKGESTDLVIPTSINGKKVVELGEQFFDNASGLRSIYVSPALKENSASVDEELIVYCEEGSPIWNQNQGWNIVTEFDAPEADHGKFEASVKEEGLYIDEYTGKQSEIVIPIKMNNKTVVGISESFFEEKNEELSLYLPEKLAQINSEPLDNVTIYCEKESAFYENYVTWNVESTYDSTYINFDLGDLPFKYNETDHGIELLSHSGSDDVLVIPSHINGKAVTEVSFDMLGNYDMIVFPETVTDITGEVKSYNYSDAFAVGIGFTLLAFVLALIVVNIILPRLKKSEEIVLTVPQLVLTFLYILVQFVFSLVVIYTGILSSLPALTISLIMVILYVVSMFIASTGRKNALAVEANIAAKTSWMKNFKLSCADLADDVKDPALKKQISRLVEDIRYSDSVSSPELEEAEAKLQDAVNSLRSAITSGNTEDIAVMCAKAQKALQERNRLSKLVK